MTGFTTPESIVNRALQRIGAQMIVSLTESSRNAVQANACYDKLRLAELQSNVWRFGVRRVALRPINTFNQSKYISFATWLIGTTYAVADVVTGSDGQIYQSLVASNLANDPTSTSGSWGLYCGPLVAQEFVTTWGSGFTYAKGDHAVGSDSNVYTSLAAGNINHNPVGNNNVNWTLSTTVDAADLTAATTGSVYTGELYFIGATVYFSLQTSNTDVPPSSKWLTLTGVPTLTVPQFAYPIGSGPASVTTTSNVFRLPNGYLRKCSQNPKQPSWPSDWLFESNFLIGSASDPVIIFRFVADIQDVTAMDALFCERLGARIGMELCEPLTQSASKLQAIEGEYKTFKTQAQQVNAIEEGYETPPEDDWVSVKVTGAYSPFQYA